MTRASAGILVRAATRADMNLIAQWDRGVFNQSDLISAKRLREWHAVNPTVFRLVVHRGSLAGYLGILPLTPHTFDAFVAGIIRESFFRGADILDIEQAKFTTRFLLFSLLVMSPIPIRAKVAYSLLIDAANWLDNNSKASSITVYATGASSSGERLLRRSGFKLAARAALRCDEHPLYMRDFTPPMVATTLSQMFHDWSAS